MLRSKAAGKRAIAMLLCCAAVFLMCFQAEALSLSISPLASTSVPETSALTKEVTESVTPGHLVSVVYRYASRSTVIGCLEDGTLLTILESHGDYYRIDCYDMNGYIAKSQVRADENGQYYVNCNPDSSESKYLQSHSLQTSVTLRGAVRERAVSLQGVPYVLGGTTTKGFDCSGFTQYIMRKIGLNIHRTVLTQLQDGIIIAKEDLQCGDLVFFQNTTGYGHFASHIGIYLGDGKLIHAGSNGITVVNLDSSYFTYHYMCARRVILSDLTPAASASINSAVQRSVSSYWRESTEASD